MHKKVFVNSKAVSGSKIFKVLLSIIIGVVSIVFVIPALWKLGKKIVSKIKKKELPMASRILPDPTTP